MPGAGTPESLPALTRADFVDFHKNYFVPNNALIAVVGDITAADAMAGLEKYFGAWKPAEVPPIDRHRSARADASASSSSTRRTRCRRKFASASSAFRASTTTMKRSTRP